MRNKRVVLTGATGFVGRRLHLALEAAGHQVLGATRTPSTAAQREPERTFVYFDTKSERSMREALSGCARAIYLIHDMGTGGDYVESERRGALAFRTASEDAGVERIVYLGAMRARAEPSRHQASRLRTGEILRAGKVPTIELQASMVIGGGSAPFEMLRELAARLPWMLLPAWLDSRSQPVAISDVVSAILHALDEPWQASGAYALPGPETLSGRAFLARTAKLLGHRPRMVGVPFAAPRLSSRWIRWVTGADPLSAEELVAGLRHDLVYDGPGYWARMPEHRRESVDEAIMSALAVEERGASKRPRAVQQLIDRLRSEAPHERV